MKIRHALSVTVLAALGASTLMGISRPVSAEKPTAQPGQAQKRQGRHKGMEQMAQKLGLTESQKTRLKAIMTQSRQQSKAVRENKSLSEEQKRERMRAIRQNSRKRMDAVLTDAQRKKLLEMRRENRGWKNRPDSRKS